MILRRRLYPVVTPAISIISYQVQFEGTKKCKVDERTL